MTELEKIYEQVKDKVSESIRVTPRIYRRDLKEDGWEYSFFFLYENDKLVKAEAFNHRELIEMYNK